MKRLILTRPNGGINAKCANSEGNCVLAFMRSRCGIGYVAIRHDVQQLHRLNSAAWGNITSRSTATQCANNSTGSKVTAVNSVENNNESAPSLSHSAIASQLLKQRGIQY